MVVVLRSDEEVRELLGEVSRLIELGESRFAGMSYEEGVDGAVRWLTGQSDEHPMAD
jgi:hypothetical protein